MAPTAPEIITITILPWPHFQAFIDAFPAIGAALYSYVPSTTTPKVTFLDPALVNPNTWPVRLDDQGAATVYLNGINDLRLFDADGVLIWSVDQYQFASGVTPPPGEIIMGSSDATGSAVAGEGVIAVPGLVPAGYRVHGITWTIMEDWGTSGGLTGLVLGDSLLVDRWGQPPALTTGTTGGQLGFHDSTEFITAPAGYVVLVQALGGTFDSTGEIHITAHWSSLPPDAP